MRSSESYSVSKVVVNSLKKFYTSEAFFLDIPVGINYEGNRIDSLALPRLDMKTHKLGFKPSLLRSESIFFSFDSPKKPSSIITKPINIEDIFHTDSRDKVAHLSVHSESNLDNNLLIHQLLHKWAQEKIWQEFENIFVIDFALLKEFVDKVHNKYFKLAHFIKYSSDLFDISDDFIARSLGKEPSKTLIVIKNYDYIDPSQYPLARGILIESAKFNVLLTSRVSNSLSDIFSFNIELNNVGYSNSDIVKHMRDIFPDQTVFSNIMGLIADNKSLSKICHSPVGLQMISYIWSKNQDITTTRLYYEFFKMVKAIGNKEYESYIFSKPVVSDFIQAVYVKENLVGRSSEAIKSALDYISSIGTGEQDLYILKYISGLIAIHENAEEKDIAMKRFFDAFISSDQFTLKIGGDIKITFIMHVIFKIFKNVGSYELVPEGLMEYIDNIILKDIKKWEKVLINSKYSSPVIVDKLLEMLDSDSKKEFLIALKVLPKLVLEEGQKQLLAIKLQDFISNSDFEIVEKSMEALGSLKDVPEIKNILISALDDPRVNVKIVVIKILSGFIYKDITYKLLRNLDSEDSWVVISVLDVLENLYYISNHLEKEAIVEALFLKLSERYGSQEIIFEKSLSLLKVFKYDTNKIANIFINKFKACSNYDELNVIVDILKNISSKLTISTTRDQIPQLMIEKLEGLKKPGILSYIMDANRHYDTRSNLQEALGEVFEFSTDKERLYLFLRAAFESKSLLVSVSSTKALTKIFSYNKEEIFSLWLEGLTKIKTDELKIVVIHSIEEVLDHLSPVQLNRLGAVIPSIIFTNKNEDILSSIINLLGKVDLSSVPRNMDQISYKLLEIINNTRDEILLINSIEALGRIFEQTVNSRVDILEVLLFRFNYPQILGERIALAKVLSKICSSLNGLKQIQIFEILNKAYSESVFGELKFVLKDILSILEASDTSGLFGMRISNPDDGSINRVIVRGNLDVINGSIDYLVKKYSTMSAAITFEDQIQLNGLFEIILSTVLQNNNEIVCQRLLSILHLAKYSNQQVLDVLSSYDALDRQKYCQKISSIFSNNLDLLQELDGLISRDGTLPIEKKFLTIEDLISNIDSFTEYVKEKNIDVEITREYISFNNVVYLKAVDVKDFELYLQYAKLIFSHLNQESNKLVKIDSSDSLGLFGSFDSISLIDDQIKLSIVHQLNTDSKKPHNAFLIIEYKTIFGDVIYKKFFIKDEKLESWIQSDINPGYKIALFGGNSEFLRYYVSSFLINQSELQSLIDLSQHWRSKEDLMNNVLLLLSEGRSGIEKYNWKDGVAISHNNLIDYRSLETRVTSLEMKVSALEHDLKKELEKLQINQQLANKLIEGIIAHIRYSENIALPRNLDPYQQALFLELVHGLNALHMAAMVVQTPMVANDQKGILSVIGELLSGAGYNMPIVGIIMQVFGSILGSVDEKMHEIISKNIASLALDAVDMSKLAKKIAITLVNKDLKMLEVHKIQDSISTKLRELATDVDFNFVKKAIDMVGGLLEAESDESRAADDAASIINVITGFLLTGKCEITINWEDNFEILKDFFIENHIISDPTLIMLVRSASDVLDKIALVRSASGSSIQSGETFLYIESQNSPLDKIDECLVIDGNNLERDANSPESFTDAAAPLILNGLEIIPSGKFLCEVYVPGCHYIKDLSVVKAVAPYEHVIESTINILANAAYIYYHPENYIYSIASSAVFVFKPQIYGLRDQFLSYVDYYSDSKYIKLASYVAVEALRSIIVALPFSGFGSNTFIYAANQGLSSGAINYYNSHPHQDNFVSEYFAKIMTTAALYPCYKFIHSMPTKELKMFAMQMCIPTLASTYYYSKYYSDVTGEFINNIIGEEKDNLLEQN